MVHEWYDAKYRQGQIACPVNISGYPLRERDYGAYDEFQII